LNPASDPFAEDVLNGLSNENKSLLPKYFYDLKGSELFEKITRTEDYYPTRTELSILSDYADEISGKNADVNLLVELGSGTSFKTKVLIESFLSFNNNLKYIPVDVSDIIIKSSEKLIEEFPDLKISGFISFYEDGIKLINEIFDQDKLILFLGSSIGNFSPEGSFSFLKKISSFMNENDKLIIGFDLIKDDKILNEAYNDSEGYTSEFNKNILRRINNELNGNFDLNKFRHVAFFNKKKSRIEMHLESLIDQKVFIEDLDKEFNFRKGERIHTENSYKFSIEKIKELSSAAGLELENFYSDNKKWFSLCSFKKIKNKNAVN
jgi:L-histidine Nalpha-methyltransferase